MLSVCPFFRLYFHSVPPFRAGPRQAGFREGTCFSAGAPEIMTAGPGSPMILAIDVGNTSIMVGVFSGEDLVYSFRIDTDRTKSPDDYGIILFGKMDEKDISSSSFTGAVLSCVVTDMQDGMAKLVEKYFGHEPIIVGPETRTGMQIRIYDPQELGADRIANAVAAYHRFGKSVIVVDLGTATTFDCVSEKGEYLGGAIVPGIELSSVALYHGTSKLPKVEPEKPEQAIGKDTVECIQSGLFFGYASMIDGLCAKLREEMGSSPEVVMTGGFAEAMFEECACANRVDEDLALHGLRLLYELNSQILC